MESCNEPQILPVTQFNLNTATALPKNFHLDRFEDAVRDRTELSSVPIDLKERAESTECDLFCVKEDKNI